MPETIQLNDDGTTLELTVTEDGSAVDLSSGVTTKSIIMQHPDGTTETFTADFKTNGSDGILQYDLEAADVAATGKYYVQALITNSAGTWRSHPLHLMTVSANLSG